MVSWWVEKFVKIPFCLSLEGLNVVDFVKWAYVCAISNKLTLHDLTLETSFIELILKKKRQSFHWNVLYDDPILQSFSQMKKFMVTLLTTAVKLLQMGLH